MKHPIRRAVILVGILLLGVLLWVSPTRIYCMRTYPPPSWDNPPIPPTAKDISITVVDRLEEVPTLLRRDDGPTILHKVVTYTIAPDTEWSHDYLFWLLVKDCWNFSYRASPGAGGVDSVDHVFKWRQSRSDYFYDMVTRPLPSNDIEVIIHTRRTANK